MLFLPYLVAEWVHITCCGKVLSAIELNFYSFIGLRAQQLSFCVRTLLQHWFLSRSEESRTLRLNGSCFAKRGGSVSSCTSMLVLEHFVLLVCLHGCASDALVVSYYVCCCRFVCHELSKRF